MKDQPTKAQVFLEEYNELCQKHGYKVVANPALRRTQGGGFEIVIQASIGKIPEQTERKNDE